MGPGHPAPPSSLRQRKAAAPTYQLTAANPRFCFVGPLRVSCSWGRRREEA